MSEIQLTIDGKTITAREGMTVLEAATAAGLDVPHLCFDPRVSPSGACYLCVVKIAGREGLAVSCHTPVADGMTVCAEDEELARTRKTILELLLAEHCADCLTCDRDGACKIQDYAYRYRADEERFGPRPARPASKNYASANKGIVYDPSKCVRCQRCVKICAEVQMDEALTLRGRASTVEVTTAFDLPLNDTTCELCGQCVSTCPTGALWIGGTAAAARRPAVAGPE